MPMMPDRLGLINFVYLEESVFRQMQDRDNNTIYFVVPDKDRNQDDDEQTNSSPYIL